MRSSQFSDRMRASVLFAHFFLIILAYYQVKPASRSLYLEYFDATQLPYAWVLGALILAALMPAYGRLVSRRSRQVVVRSTTLFIAGMLVLFRFLPSSPISALLFYIFVDIISVVLVEQFWSLANSQHVSHQGRRWYGVIGSGGLLGGIVAGQLVSFLLEHVGLSTLDLLLVAAALIILLAVFVDVVVKLGGSAERMEHPALPELPERPQWRDWLGNPYVVAIAGILLISQLLEPLVEFQFMHFVALEYPEQKARTAYLANFFSVMGALALMVNVLITPLIHRYLGVISGLLAQPLMLLLSSVTYLSMPGLLTGAIAKISDRGLAYSINRASRELLYVPIDAETIYKLKAWIDMLGYRAFKMAAALAILILSEWTKLISQPQDYAWFVLAGCVVWMGLVFRLTPHYKRLTSRESELARAAEMSRSVG